VGAPLSNPVIQKYSVVLEEVGNEIRIVVFPGSNCDHDAYHVLKHVLQARVEYIWHKDTALRLFDAIILPGGFAYGDYLRAGAVARFAPVMQEVIKFAANGGKVIGICNGFQVLVEAGLLPGALIPNDHMRFRCQEVFLKVVNNGTDFTRSYQAGRFENADRSLQRSILCEEDVIRQLQARSASLFNIAMRKDRSALPQFLTVRN
jgi:phosphoribosylformylglycinamidine synthase